MTNNNVEKFIFNIKKGCRYFDIIRCKIQPFDIKINYYFIIIHNIYYILLMKGDVKVIFSNKK